MRFSRDEIALAALAFVCVAPSVTAAQARTADRAAPHAAADRFDRVVVDAGHGGDDEGARGARGLLEKELVLDVAQRLGKRLARRGVKVVYTRDRDVFVPLETRNSIANDARADLFVSIHANAARSEKPSGFETYFASLDASDEAARKLAERENSAFGAAGIAPSERDPLLALLGDMIATEHLLESDEFARLAHEELLAIDGLSSRGVKQAPFVVLMGVQMPASLVEIGFVSNPEEARTLLSARRRDAIAAAIERAVIAFGQRYDARRGVDSRRDATRSAEVRPGR
jgi:N-acetylmuramoyl-L-alanine amidase